MPTPFGGSKTHKGAGSKVSPGSRLAASVADDVVAVPAFRKLSTDPGNNGAMGNVAPTLFLGYSFQEVHDSLIGVNPCQSISFNCASKNTAIIQ